MSNPNIAAQLSPRTAFKRYRLLFALVLLPACGSGTRALNQLLPGDTACAPDQAQIGVGDGFLSLLCGCQEAPSGVLAQPTNAICTISIGKTVFFHYLGTVQRHQIVSPSGAFPPSPVSDPSVPNPIRVHAFQLNSTGTYDFRDQYNFALTGQIVVQ